MEKLLTGPLLDEVARGFYQLVFFTPEIQICNKTWKSVIESDAYTKRLEVLVIDVAHCVKKW